MEHSWPPRQQHQDRFHAADGLLLVAAQQQQQRRMQRLLLGATLELEEVTRAPAQTVLAAVVLLVAMDACR